jgi:hypothetical protein
MRWPRLPALSEFDHVACPWRRVVPHRCPAIADVPKILFDGPAGDKPLRCERKCDGFGRRDIVAAVDQRLFTDLAADHERADRRARRRDEHGVDHPADALQDLFSQIDGNKDGAITKTEFENALGTGGTNTAAADKVFGELDTNGDGSVSLDEMTSALKGAGGHHGHGHHMHAGAGGAGGGDGSDPLLQALSGASSTAVTNSDGSTTTSITYADGSKVSMTTPAVSTSSTSSATSSYNLIEQLIQREAQSLSASVASSLSMSV